MSKHIILSIQPKHFNNIMSGSKEFEFRKTIPPNIGRIYFYVSAPIKKILAYIDSPEILHEDKEKIWEITKYKSGIEKIFFDEYFTKKQKAYAIVVKNVNQVEYSLQDFNVLYSPQNFCYVNNPPNN